MVARFILIRATMFLPFDGLVEDVAVGGILGCECVAAILYAEHHEGFGAVVANAAATVGGHADNRAFTDREDLAVDLKLSAAPEEEIQFLMVLVGMQETCLLTGSENLK